MLEASARLLRLLGLLQARGFWTGTDLAERLEVTQRTVRRDVERLRALGYPVHSSTGVAGGYQLGAGASLPPLLLDDEEALAVALGLRTASAGTVAGVQEAALRALAKLDQVLPARIRKRVAELYSVVAPLYWAGPVVRPQVLSSLATACRDHRQAELRYTDQRGRPTARTIEPHGLVHTGARWYLVAWDEARADWRTFRVDRIEGDVELGRRFTPRKVPGGDTAAYVSRSVATRPYRFRARVIFHAPASTIAERVPPLAGFLQPLGNDRCVLESGAHSLDVLAMHIALVGEDFDIEEPPELVDKARELAARLRRAARPGPSSTSRASTPRGRK